LGDGPGGGHRDEAAAYGAFGGHFTMAGFFVRLVGTLSIAFVLTTGISVGDALSRSELKIYITNKLSDQVKANLQKYSATTIDPGQQGVLIEEDKHDTLYIRYKPDNGQCKIDMTIKVNSYSQGCHGKKFTPTLEDGCKLEKTECSGGNGCRCYFNLKKN
jgi:hypothetical protein